MGKEGFGVSVTVVDRLLEEFGMGQRKPRKIKTMRHHPDRNTQFEHIAELKRMFHPRFLASSDAKRSWRFFVS